MTVQSVTADSPSTSPSVSSSPSLSSSSSAAPGAAARWGARVAWFLAVGLLTFDVGLKVLGLAPAREATIELGYSAGAFTAIGWLGLLCLVLYVVPRTAPIGAVLWTGYLGGAIATHLRLGNPLFSHTLFPIYVAILLWLPLWLRDPRVRGLLAPRRER